MSVSLDFEFLIRKTGQSDRELRQGSQTGHSDRAFRLIKHDVSSH